MHRIGNRALLLLMFVGLIASLAGCEIMPDPEFASLKSTLRLRTVKANRGASADAIDISFELANRATTDAKACVGPSRSVDFKAGSFGGTSFDFVDHAGCTREFTIQPGNQISWAETITVHDLRQGPLEIEVEVQITNPNRCGGWGNCASFYLKSNRVTIP